MITPLRALVFLLLITPAVSWSEDNSREAHEWLVRMSQAAQMLNYEGTFIYLHNGRLETMQIVHKFGDKGEQERLFSLNGVAREIVRDNSKITCILPDDKSVVVDKSRPKKLFPDDLTSKDVMRLEQYYKFELGEQDRIAGRKTQQVLVKPRDGYRFGYRLWLDSETGLLLKSDMVNETGEPIEQIMFTRIDYSAVISDKALMPELMGKQYKWFEHEKDTVEAMELEKGWDVENSPEGFMMTERGRRRLPAGKMPVEHFVYSDGLATVSVYIEKVEEQNDLMQGVSYMGAVHVFANVVNDHQVTVVGEVPAETVEFIGNSVRYKTSD
ncbi:MAG: MucB/RseB C-terminal domain-containing protein [Gammaproteobacteria bacterium]|nr:MucB/RseB C-terminal domain-containing protein [Gammaproteobacteria bacterium]MDH5593932.1 MucB/RseB C-terminal domain-containing protein [Gammaproteobacteria bacterium]